ncbi:ABC transporter ATP-binding protein [Anoxynatronum sibiricum]|uniref:ABC transporter ATP-binding protein n=1 Tax=Anoxynatronum sibiricum TaxID=210623 RepID=A0ABU9VT13_9CLOT
MLLELESLVKRYQDHLAVDHLNLKIKDGEIMGLLGPNGAGKTTTLNMITGLARIDAGTIRIFGEELHLNSRDVKRKIGVVPQEIAVFDDLTAEENVTFFGKLYGLRGNLLREGVKEALAFSGLTGHEKQFPKKYSGGMKRRLNIACAIVHQPRLLIMDEPTVGIDPQSRSHILESVRTLQQKGTTILYTSHYMEEVDDLCSRIAIMDQGRIIAQGTSEELKSMISSEERIDIILSEVNYSLVAEMKQLPGVLECHLEGKKLTVLVQKDSGLIGKISQIIGRFDSEIRSLQVEKVTLENVFLTLTGKSLRDSGTGEMP